MTELLRLRVESGLKKESEQIARQMGLTLGEAVRLFLAQMVRRKDLPFPVKAYNDAEILPDRDRQSETLAKFYE